MIANALTTCSQHTMTARRTSHNVRSAQRGDSRYIGLATRRPTTNVARSYASTPRRAARRRPLTYQTTTPITTSTAMTIAALPIGSETFV